MSVLDEVINQASIRELLDYYGVKKQGKLYICPFHNDTHASLSVTKDDKHWECFTCQEKGNIDNLVEKMERLNGRDVDYVHRMDMIIKLQHLNVEFSLNENIKPLTPEQKKIQRYYGIMNDAMMLGENGLAFDINNNGLASRYLSTRGISENTIKTFHIGYNSKSMLYDNLSSKYDEDDLFKVGILAKTNEGRLYDHQYDRLLIPILDKDGKCVGFGGRYLEDINPNEIRINKVKYKNTKVTDIFKKSQILFNYNLAKRFVKESNELMIVEGYFDVVSAYEMGIKNIVALMGVELTDEHMELIKDLNVTVTLCLDNDNAGRAAMYKIILSLLAEDIEVNVINTQSLNKGKDMNDFLLNEVSLDQLKLHKISAIEFIFEQTFEICKENREVNIDTVQKVYNIVFKNKSLNNTGNEVRFYEYVSKKYGYTRDDIINVCKPTQNNTVIALAMQNFFCSIIKNKIMKYAEMINDNVFQAFVVQERVTREHILEGMNNEEFIQNNGRKLLIVDFCNKYLMNTPEYLEFVKNYNPSYDRLLNNVYAFDKGGELIKLDHLTPKQKDLVVQQINETFDEEDRQYIKDDNDRFTRLYIADTLAECNRFLGEDYPITDKPECIESFNNGKMSVVNYQCVFHQNLLEDFHRTQPNKYTTEDGSKYLCVLMYNNVGNKLHLTTDNYISRNIEKEPYQESNSINNISTISNNIGKARASRMSSIQQKFIHNQETAISNE